MILLLTTLGVSVASALLPLINIELYLAGISAVGSGEAVALGIVAGAGQSIGKIVTGIRVVKLDGGRAPTAAMLLRQIVGYLLTLATGGLGLFLSVFSIKGRALHDHLSGTVVVYGDSRVRA